MTWLRRWLSDIRAALRGEHRVAPRGTTGRVYDRDEPGPVLAKTKLRVTVRVWRAATGKWEER